MKRVIERIYIKILKILKVDLLTHAHIQIGAGHNTYLSGERYVINELLTKILKKNPQVIFDVGANTGGYAKQLRDRFKNTPIFCFEPIIENFNQLVLNTQGLDINCNHIALGKEDGILTFFKGSNDISGEMISVYKGGIDNIFTFAGNTDEKIISNATTIDNFCMDKIEFIDFLKIDVEGHELEVIKGTNNMINENKINIIQFEFNEFNIFSKSFMWDFYNLLKNYDFYRIMPENKLYPMGEYESSHEIFRYQNILAINKSLNFVYQP